MTERELDEILTFRWPGVTRRVMAEGDDFLKGFVRSIARHGKRKSWTPSAKQAALLRRLVRDHSAAPEPQFDLIEN
jgi:hypothetical protein